MQNMQNVQNTQNIDMQNTKIAESESRINSRTCLGHLVLFLEHPVKELCSPEDCDRSGGGRLALERPLRLGLGLKGKLNIIRKKSKPLSIGYLLEMKESNFFSKIEIQYTKMG